MARVLCVLMLVGAQLLTGSGGSFYVCISNDLSCICLDSGPATCICCQCKEKVGECGRCRCQVSCKSCAKPRQNEKTPNSSALGFLSDQPCSCTHVLIATSAGQASSVIRALTMTDTERFVQLFVSQLCIFTGNEVVAPPVFNFCWRSLSPIRDFASTVISTVVIRC